MTTHITKTWFDGDKVVTQEIPESEVYRQEPRCAVIVEVFAKDWRLDYMSLPVGKHRLYTQEYVYTTPPAAPRQWVELTDDEARALVNRATFGDKTNWQALVYMVDAKLKEKNAA